MKFPISFIPFAVVLALMFVACGDDSTSINSSSFPEEVADKAELNSYECNFSAMGVQIYVESLGKNYECDGDKWFESYDQTRSGAKDKSWSSGSKNSSSSRQGNYQDVCSDAKGCEVMDKSDISTWHFVRDDSLRGDAEYTYLASGKNLVVDIRRGYEVEVKDYSMYDMESEAGLEMAFNVVKATCEEGNGNERIVKKCTETLIESGTLTDERDGKIYKTVKIGDQWWMAENLNYDDSVATPSLKKNSSCHKKDQSNCTKYGRLYTAAAAVDSVKLYADKKDSLDCGENALNCLIGAYEKIQGICPTGWRLPDTTDWLTLFDATGIYPIRYDKYGGWGDAKRLKSRSGWYGSNSNTDEYGFSVLPAGYGKRHSYDHEYEYYGREGETFLFTSTPIFDLSNENVLYSYKFSSSGDYAYRIKMDSVSKSGLYSVRCVKGSENINWKLPKCNSNNQGLVAPEETLYFICDNGAWRLASFLEKDTRGEICTSNDVGKIINGKVKKNNEYYCAEKGWLDVRENMWAVPKDVHLNPNIKYDSIIDERDGEVYKIVKIGDQWWMAQNLGYVSEGNQECGNRHVMGCFYSWSTALGVDCSDLSECKLKSNENIQGVCPKGWHIPTLREWSALFESVSGTAYADARLMSRTGWKNALDVSDTVGFSMLPAGFYNKTAGSAHEGVGTYARFWTSTQWNSHLAHHIFIKYGRIETSSSYKMVENSVRCVKDDD